VWTLDTGGGTYLHLDASLEADAVWNGGLEVGDGVELLLHLGRGGRLGQVGTTRLVG